jgi:TolB-like protein
MPSSRRIAIGLTALALLGLEAEAAAAQQRAAASPQVAVLPLEVERGASARLRRLADSCGARLLEHLRATKLRVVSVQASLEKLRAAGVAPFAVDGTVSEKDGEIAAELRLMAVSTLEEQRAYAYSGAEPEGVCRLAAAAAPRIAAVIREAEGTAD